MTPDRAASVVMLLLISLVVGLVLALTVEVIEQPLWRAILPDLRGIREQVQQPLRGQLVARPLGAADHGGGPGDQQRTQPLMAGAADPAHALLVAG
jgi:hypothetical protein